MKKETINCPDCGTEIDIEEIQVHHLREQVEAEMRDVFEKSKDQEIKAALKKASQEQKAELAAQEEQIGELSKALKAAKKAELERDQLKEDLEDQVMIESAKAATKARKDTLATMNDVVKEKVEVALIDKETEIEKLRLKNDRLAERVEQGLKQNRSAGGEIEGEALEVVIETRLKNEFLLDEITPVARGRKGADILQTVVDERGTPGEKILWEIKGHENWQEKWLAKIRQDALDNSALVKVIVTRALPPNVDRFDSIGDVWVCQPHEAMIVAHLLREMCIRVRSEQRTQAHLMTIQERVVEYIRSPEFESAMNAVLEAYRDMQDDNRKLREYVLSKTKKQDKNLQAVVDALTSVIGTMSAIGAAEDFPITHLLDEPKEEDGEDDDL
jgi:hypothetical protein